MLYDGHLAERLRELRGEGLSYEQIGRRLHSEHGVDVSQNTVRAWLRQLGIEAEVA